MWGKFFAALLCLALLGVTISSVYPGPNYYDPSTPEEPAVKALTPPDKVKRAEAYLQLMQAQNLEGLRDVSDPSILNEAFYKAVPVVASYANPAKPMSTRTISYQFTKSTDGKKTWETSRLIIGHYYPAMVIFTTTDFIGEGKGSKINGFNLRRFTAADVESVRFTIDGKSQIHYAVLVASLVVFMFSLLTLYIALTRPRLKFRWFWAIFIATGIGRLGFNWGTTTLDFNLLDLHIPLLVLSQPLFQYPVIVLCLPVGAILFWLLAKQKALPINEGSKINHASDAVAAVGGI